MIQNLRELRRARWPGALAVMCVLTALLLPTTVVAAGRTIAIGEAVVERGETVNGDLTANVGKAIVNGEVTGDVRANVGGVEVSGRVGGNVISDVGEVRILTGGVVGGDAISSLGHIDVRGQVAGDVELDAGEIVISGHVGGDVYVGQGRVVLRDGAVVEGKVTVDRGRVDRHAGATAKAIDVRVEVDDDDWHGPRFRFGDFDFWDDWRVVSGPLGVLGPLGPYGPFGGVARAFGWLFGTLFATVIGAVAVLLFPTRMERMAAAVTRLPAQSLGFGCLGIIAAIVMLVLLVISVIGLLVVPFYALALFFIAAVAGPITAFALGRALLAHFRGPEAPKPAPILELLAGALILGLLAQVPFLGRLVSAFAGLAGFGAMLSTVFGSRPSGGQTM